MGKTKTEFKKKYYPHIEKAYKEHTGMTKIVGKRKEFLEQLAIDWGKDFEHERHRLGYDDFTLKNSEVEKKAKKFIGGFFKMFEPT